MIKVSELRGAPLPWMQNGPGPLSSSLCGPRLLGAVKVNAVEVGLRLAGGKGGPGAAGSEEPGGVEGACAGQGAGPLLCAGGIVEDGNRVSPAICGISWLMAGIPTKATA